MKAALALLLLACAGSVVRAADPVEIWVDMSTDKDGSVLVRTNSVKSTGNIRTASALLISPKDVREVQLESNCANKTYRLVGKDKWLNDDPAGVRRICTNDFRGLSRFDKSDIDRIKRVQSGGAIYTGAEAIGTFTALITGNHGGFWLSGCKAEVYSIRQECNSYVSGIWHAARASKAICDKNAQQSEVLSGFRKELENMSSGERRRPRYDIVMEYLKSAYPCPQN